MAVSINSSIFTSDTLKAQHIHTHNTHTHIDKESHIPALQCQHFVAASTIPGAMTTVGIFQHTVNAKAKVKVTKKKVGGGEGDR